jgi:fructose-bisphosphate aldolase class II
VALVDACKKGGYALPAVNVSGTDSINAVLEAAQRNRSDVIVQVSHGGARFVGGPGIADAHKARVLGAVAAALHVHAVAEHYGVAVVLHTDHAAKPLLPWIEALVARGEAHFASTGRPLFTSHMLDLSEEPIDENLAISKATLARLAPMGMGLEIELGVTGGEEDGVGAEHDGAADDRLYTNPSDVLRAFDELTPIGMLSIAASFGNVHGVYAPGAVKLRPEILAAAQALIAERHGATKPANLVFHGGSGSEKDKIAAAIAEGVWKFNIDTDTQHAFAKGVGDYVKANPVAFTQQVDPATGKPCKKVYDPRVWLREGQKSMAARLDEAFRDLGSVGRTVCA